MGILGAKRPKSPKVGPYKPIVALFLSQNLNIERAQYL